MQGGLLEPACCMEVCKSGVFKGSRAVWSGWSLEFKIEKTGRGGTGLDYGDDKPW